MSLPLQEPEDEKVIKKRAVTCGVCKKPIDLDYAYAIVQVYGYVHIIDCFSKAYK